MRNPKPLLINRDFQFKFVSIFLHRITAGYCTKMETYMQVIRICERTYNKSFEIPRIKCITRCVCVKNYFKVQYTTKFDTEFQLGEGGISLTYNLFQVVCLSHFLLHFPSRNFRKKINTGTHLKERAKLYFFGSNIHSVEVE